MYVCINCKNINYKNKVGNDNVMTKCHAHFCFYVPSSESHDVYVVPGMLSREIID